MAEDAKVLPEIILFEHPNFRGAHRHVFQTEKNLAVTHGGAQPGPAGGQFDDRTSSIVVIEGTWILYENRDLTGDKHEVGPGAFPNVGDNLHIPHDFISSVELKKSPS
jgi:hypothetical protein